MASDLYQKYASSKEQGLTQAEFVTLWREGVAQQRYCAVTRTLNRTLTRTSCPPLSLSLSLTITLTLT